jgi:twinkle protein
MGNIIKGANWAELGFTSLTKTFGKEYSTCPQCSHTRKKTRHKCVTVIHTGDKFENTAYCGQCYIFFVVGDKKHSDFNKNDFKPALHTQNEKVYDLPKMPLLPSETDSNLQRMYKYFSERKISKETLQAMQVQTTNVWIQGNTCEINGKEYTTKDGIQNTISFPYFRNSELVNIKYRSATKAFRLEKGAELILYNFDVLYTDIKTLIITEGEIDCLSFLECGITNVVSVPNGAAKNANLSYLDSASDLLNQIDTFIIATDNDKPGELLSEELIRRLGREKCKRVVYPDGCKDSNEVLCKFGKDDLVAIIQKATEIEIKGILSSEIVIKQALDLYLNGYPKVYPIKIQGFDDIFNFNLGEVTIFTGGANVGKTTFINECLQRLNFYHGFKCGILSWEQQPVGGHLGRILQKYYGKTFFAPNQYQLGMQQMTRQEFDNGAKYYTDNFKFFDCRGAIYNVNDICNIAKELVKKYGINLLYIDPFTHIDKSIKPKGMSDTDYISVFMCTLTNLAKELNIHIILVAHPAKSRTLKYIYLDAKGEEQAIFFGGKNDINGSVNFDNTADNIISIGKHPISFNALIFVGKVRYQDYVGKIGDCELLYDTKTTRYNDLYLNSTCNYTQTEIQPQNDSRRETISYSTSFEQDNNRDLPF